LKVSIFVFILGMLATGSVVAEESGASPSRTSTAAEAVTVTDQSEDIIGKASSASEARVSSVGLAEQPALRRDGGKASHSVAQSFNLDCGNNQIAERAIDEGIIDRLASFDPSDGGRSARYSVSFDLESEDSDWNFEVTVTMEF
jgi:hypothetical protein